MPVGLGGYGGVIRHKWAQDGCGIVTHVVERLLGPKNPAQDWILKACPFVNVNFRAV